jgi:hypothetical protein
LDDETRLVTVWHEVLDVDRPDAGARGPLAQGSLESFDSLGLPFRLDLYASVPEVADEAVHALAASRRLGEIPEAHALYAAADRIPSRDYRQSGTRAIRAMVF